MEALKALAIRRLPKLCQWISTEAAADLPGRSASCRSGLQAFALALNKRLADDAGRSRNLIFSPVSVYAALSLVAGGGRERTLSELLGVLGAPSRDDLTRSVGVLARQALADQSQTGGPLINFACGVWHDKTRPLKPAYIDAVVKEYKAQTCAVDFRRKPEQAAKQINGWVAKSTKNLIPSIFSPGALSPLTDLVLANAIYFKGRWEEPFDKELTKKDKFHRLDGTDVDVPFMRASGRRLLACHDGFKVLQLRYERGRPLPAQPAPVYSMCVFLPDARDGLWRLADKIACDPDFLQNHLPRKIVMVDDIRLPKFKVSFVKDVAGALQELGVREAFDEGKANLSDMAENGAGGRLALQQVMHRAVIEVNEEGTEAAAVTYPMRKMCSWNPPPPPPPVEFVADHPFAFFVIEEVSGAILFAGHVVDPSIN